MDNPAPLMHVDWIRWFQALADAVTAPITGISPSQITMPSGFLLGRTTAGIGAAETISVTAPLTLAAGALGITGSALTRVNDTNVTLTLTGSPTTALLAATGITVGWTGVLPPSRGGTGTTSYAAPGPTVDAEPDNEAAWAMAAVSAPVRGATGLTGPQGPAGLDADSDSDAAWAFAATQPPLTISNDTTTNASMFPVWVTANAGALPLKVTSTKLSFNPSTGTLTSTNMEIGGVAGSSLTQLGGSTGQINWNGQIGTTGIDTTRPMFLGFRINGTGSADLMRLFTDNQTTSAMHVKGTGRVGIGTSGPTAWLHVQAGTATASTAPFKLTSGTNNTTAEAGAMEYNGTNLFFTRAGTVREGVLTQSAVTTEVLVTDTSVTVNIGGTTYKLLARA